MVRLIAPHWRRFLQHFRQAVEQASLLRDAICPGRLSPLAHDFGDLLSRYDARQQGAVDEIVRLQIGNFSATISRESSLLLDSHVRQLAHASIDQPIEVTANESGVLSGDGHVSAEAEAVANEDMAGKGHSRREGLVDGAAHPNPWTSRSPSRLAQALESFPCSRPAICASASGRSWRTPSAVAVVEARHPRPQAARRW